MEEKELAGGVSTLLEDWIQDVMSTPDWGIVIPNPDLIGHFGKRVFFAPFCDLDPRDYPDAYAYYDAVKQKACFPDLLAEYAVVDSNWSNLYQLVSFTGTRELSFNKAGHHCAQIANSAGLGQFESAHFDVWMSNEHTDPASRFERSETPYVLPSGATVAHDWEDLTDTEIRHEINETAFGQIVSAKRVATGTKPDGTRQDDRTRPHNDPWQPPIRYDLHLINWTNFNWVPERTDDAFRNLAPGNTSKTVGQWSQASQEEERYPLPAAVTVHSIYRSGVPRGSAVNC